jgi:hypothetical protein
MGYYSDKRKRQRPKLTAKTAGVYQSGAYFRRSTDWNSKRRRCSHWRTLDSGGALSVATRIRSATNTIYLRPRFIALVSAAR